MTNQHSDSESDSLESSEGQPSPLESANEEIQALLQTARESNKAIDKMKQQIESYANELASLKETIKTHRDEVINLVEAIKKDSANTKLIADRAEEKDSKVNEYQKELQDLSRDCHRLAEQIEKLLPGATSAGLASAFKTRKDAFIRPKNLWAVLHIISVLAIVGVGVFVLLYGTEITDIKGLIFYALKRSPVIAGIILLEEFFRRNYNIALRLEEDYGYKEVLSRSFEGYKKQMEGIKKDSDTAVSLLSTDLLSAMAQQPGRLIDKEKPITAPPADLIEQVTKIAKDFLDKNK